MEAAHETYPRLPSFELSFLEISRSPFYPLLLLFLIPLSNTYPLHSTILTNMSLRIRDGPAGDPGSPCPKLGSFTGIPILKNETRIIVSTDHNQTYNADAMVQCCAPNPVETIYSCYPLCKAPASINGTDDWARFQLGVDFRECLQNRHYGGKNNSSPFMVAVAAPETNGARQVKIGLLQAAMVGLALVSLTAF